MLICNSKIHFHHLGQFKLMKTILKSLNVLQGLSPVRITIQTVVTIHGEPSVQFSCMMNFKIDFAKTKCLGTIWSTEMILIA